MTMVILFWASRTYSQKPAISLLGSTKTSIKGTSQLSNFNWTIPSGTNRMMILNFYFERDFRDGSDGGNWPSNYYSSGDYFKPFPLSVGGKTPTLIRAASASWRGDGSDKEIGPSQAQFGAIMYRYVLTDAEGLPTGNTTFNVSGIVAPTNAGDELAVSIEVYNNVSPIITYDGNYEGVAWMVANKNTAQVNEQTNRNTFTMQAKYVPLPRGRKAEDFWYEGFASNTKDQTITSNWNLVNNIQINNDVSNKALSATSSIPSINNESDGSDMLIAYTSGETSVPSITMVRPGGDASYIMNARLSTLTLAPLAMPSVSGTVYWDTNGATSINGNGTDGDGLFVNVLDANNKVVYAATVGTDGKYTLPVTYVVETYKYTLQLTKNQGTIGSPAPATELNADWVTVGESSSSTGNDGNPNGLLATGTIGTIDITNMNFGINNPTVLPVSYSKPLSALFQGNQVSLEWTSGVETNNKYFDIQRSADSKTGWASIGSVNSYFPSGNGNDHDYSFTDTKPLNSTSYYRLVQYDYDGESSISNVASVSNKMSFSLAPNPATSTVKVSGVVKGVALRIYSANGQLVKEKIASASSESIDISSIPAGLYILQVISKDGSVQSAKLMKQ